MSESDETQRADHAPRGEPGTVPRRFARLRAVRKRRLLADIALVAFAIALGIFAGLYITREKVAGGLIDSTLAQYDIPATYDVVSIGPSDQVIENIVIGDPNSPDMTVERAVVSVLYRFGTPSIGTVRLENPRLYGRWDGNRISFGSLDRAIYEGESDAPFTLPDIDLAIVDGRALIRSPWGDVGAKLEGSGLLSGGFDGVLGAVAPRMSAGDCRADGASLYGNVETRGGRVSFDGPLRLAALDCDSGASLGPSDLQLSASTKDFASFDLRGRLEASRLSQPSFRAATLAGDVALTRRDQGALVSNFDLQAGSVQAAGVAASSLRLEGRIRSRQDLSHVAFDGSMEGEGIRPGQGPDNRLAEWQRAAGGTMAEPLLARLRQGLRAEGAQSEFSAEIQARRSDGRTTIIVPQARWRGTSGQTILALSRGQYAFGGPEPASIAGNFSTGGNGIPRITGRMEGQNGAARTMRLTMADYAAGDARLAVPDMRISQTAGGAIALSGRVLASGAFPGGTVQGLDMPISGRWNAKSGLALGNRCITPRFERMTIASLTLAGQAITLCPPRGGAIVQNGAGGLKIAAGVPELELAGELGETPIRIDGGPVGVAFPGVLVARDMAVELGEGGSSTRFLLSGLKAELGPDIRGSFDDLEMRMAAVPLDITRASGEWAYRDGALTLSDASIRVTDREASARFNPMVAEGASLRLADNRIEADAALREEQSGRHVVDAAIIHNLGTGTGHADLSVPGLTFDEGLQPTDVTPLALGVVANAAGTVEGTGRIDWSGQGVTSTGRFTTEALDFAAAFGPVRGLAGTVRFTDLLGLVTAPDQQITVAEVNPGIPVENGVIRYALEPGKVFAFQTGKWPFLGGTLELRPVRMTLGVEETRRYVFVIEGLDAARFLARMDLANLSASGTFDGTLPVVFDKSGGRIEDGFLRSRPPGGNLSYVGALSYEDMPAIANFAFDALKSLDYKDMTIGMDGALEGEIVTRVRIDGVSQGEAASKNIITRRLASLPIRFNVNIRAPFYQLLSSLKSLYDPSAVRDPRELGLLMQEDGALVPDPEAPAVPPDPATDSPAVLPRNDEDINPQAIQSAESETMP